MRRDSLTKKLSTTCEEKMDVVMASAMFGGGEVLPVSMRYVTCSTSLPRRNCLSAGLDEGTHLLFMEPAVLDAADQVVEALPLHDVPQRDLDLVARLAVLIDESAASDPHDVADLQ